MKGIPAIWFGLLLLALLTALTSWIERVVQPPAPKRDGSTRHDPDYIVNQFSSIRTDGFGNPRYELSGAEMRHYPDDDSTVLIRPHYTLYSQKQQTTQILSDTGRMSSHGEKVEFVDNVKVIRAATAGKGEMTVLTSFLRVIPDQELAETDRPVMILQAPHTVVHANGMQYYKKDGILNLYKGVKVHYERPQGRAAKPLNIEQVVGGSQFFDQVTSVVKPDSTVISVLPSTDTKKDENAGSKKKSLKPSNASIKSGAPESEKKKNEHGATTSNTAGNHKK